MVLASLSIVARALHESLHLTGAHDSQLRHRREVSSTTQPNDLVSLSAMSRPGSPLANESLTLPHLVDGNSDSELSDVPTNIELPASNSRSDDADVASRSVKKAKKRRSARSSDSWPTTKKRRVAATETDTDCETDNDEDELDLLALQELDIDTHQVSRFESLPREVSHQAIHVTAGVLTSKASAENIHRCCHRPRPCESRRDLSETCHSDQPTEFRDMESTLSCCLRLS